MARGDVFQLSTGGVYYAWRYNAARRKWERRSTGKKHYRAALEVARGWLERGEMHEAGAGTTADEHAEVDLSTHITDFIGARRNSPEQPTGRHLGELESRLTRIVDATGWQRLRDITLDRLQAALADVADAKKSAAKKQGRERLSNATLNAYRSAWKAFTRWAHRTGRTAADPLAQMPKWKVDGFRVHKRRALTHDEFTRLLHATEVGPVIQGISGEDRAILYLLAVTTGLRRGELASLTRASFRLDAKPPVVEIEAVRAKNRRTALQPLVADTVERLRGWLACRDLRVPLWVLPDGMAEVIAEDLKAAKVPIKDEMGAVADFHALRHTFGTWLALAGVTTQAAQRLMRHSTMDLTLKYYTHLAPADLSQAQEKAMPQMNRIDPTAAATAPSTEIPRAPEASESASGASGAGAEGDSISGTDCARIARECSTQCAPVQRHEGDDCATAPDGGASKPLTFEGDTGADAPQCDAMQPDDENAPSRTRTWNPLIKSQLLYQLS